MAGGEFVRVVGVVNGVVNFRAATDGRPEPAAKAESATSIGVEPLTDALQRLETLDARQAEVVKMRVVWGLEVREIATALGLSASTVKRDWRFARAWLMDETAHLEHPT